MIAIRDPPRKGLDINPYTLTIHGEPASKANSRQLVLIKGRMVPIKSKKALSYMRAFDQQCPILDPLMDEDLAIAMRIYYKTRRPDLDESLILDLLQGKVYKNDRAIKLKHVEHGLSKDDPRVVMAIGPLGQASEVIETYKALVG
jgi:Holliday junction resolvase RusA-like endonuclease|tara:strand:- start:1194 stop:1628 length:435 start_codon:yes stop_codon:yes gene_type:complete